MPQHPLVSHPAWIERCHCRGLLPWVHEVIRLAQAAEDDDAYREALASLAHINATIDEVDAELWALDPAWAATVLGECYAVNADGTPDRTKRLC